MRIDKKQSNGQIVFQEYSFLNNSLNINNRKYLGSKQRLLNFISSVILEKSPQIETFIDGFAGTGVVANHFKKYARKIITNDLLYSNFIINKVFLASSEDNCNLNKLAAIISNLNTIEPRKGYVYKNYGGAYFTQNNAALIDGIREEIENLYKNNECSEQEYYILLTSLLFAVDKIANTVGQYDAYLKNIGEPAYDSRGRHRIDSNVYKKIRLQLPQIDFSCNNEIYNQDLNLLIKKIEADVLYLDPPYNNRQYIDCYHVLENICRWEKPLLFGKTKKFEREHLKSRYSRKREAGTALAELIANAGVEHIFLSYNNEGIIPASLISGILKTRGSVEVFEQEYGVFGNGAGRSQKRKIIERIYYCKVK